MNTSFKPLSSRLDIPTPCSGMDEGLLLCVRRYSCMPVRKNTLCVIDSHTGRITPLGVDAPGGALVRRGEMHHLLFIREDGGHTQMFAAVSKTLSFSAEEAAAVLSAQDAPFTHAWRDPQIYADQGSYHMLCGAELKAPLFGRKGCIAHFVSEDLTAWQELPPMYTPYSQVCAPASPCLFSAGEFEYLLYTSLSDRIGTQYRFRRKGETVWRMPAQDLLDSRAFLHGRVFCSGDALYLCGILPTRDCDHWGYRPDVYTGQDYNSWDEGGALIFHRLVIESDGALRCAPIHQLDENACGVFTPAWSALNGAWQIGDTCVSVSSPYGAAQLLSSERMPDRFMLSMTLLPEPDCRKLGVVLHTDSAFAEGYYLYIEPGLRRIQLRTPFRMSEQGSWRFPQEIELEQHYPAAPDGQIRLVLIRDNDVLRLYANGAAFTCRAQDRTGGQLGLYVSHGDARFADIRLFIPKEDL